MKTVPELKEVEKDVEREEVVAVPCLELGAVLQEELVAAQEAEMVVDPVQESEEHQQINQVMFPKIRPSN